MTKQGCVYLLVDPRDQQVRYVGSTIQTAVARRRGHMSDARTGNRNSTASKWLRELLSAGCWPDVRVVEQGIPDNGLLLSLEQEWIAHGRDFGWKLTNTQSPRHGNRGVVASPETLKKLRDSHTGKTASADTKALMSASQTGRKHSAETLVKLKASAARNNAKRKKLSDADVQEIKRLHGAGVTQKRISMIYDVDASLISRIIRGERRAGDAPCGEV